jgi:hypothetical protein
MALDDYMEPEVGLAVAVTAAVTAAVAAPPVRKAFRQGAVYGLAGILMAGDKIAAMARSVKQGAQQAAASAESTTQQPAT